ncbi:serine hydrolase [Flagellimonas olearia]|uniref:Beta-lactamase-related domain-containing protein n=1 Tax=Flagellimonas olearia TaxID=552546 RepID=A0A444VLS0_9FLAO|nr:serine hydrolase [Allomuricauda olearia]RYC51741.1 hypothetical protein DN53_12995 [Allomuricauda olearia]
MINFKWFLFCVYIIFFSENLLAHTGKIAFAYPISGVKIDGKLNDWPQSIERVKIDNFLGAPASTKAFFRIGYNLSEQNLYIAVEVEDNDNVVSNANEDIWWNPEDRQILYLDFDHNPRGDSGVVGIAASQSGYMIRKVHNNWDPVNSRLSPQDIKVQVKHKKDLTVYEWQIHLGKDLFSNRSIGLDFMVQNVESKTEKTESLVWSSGGAKIAMPFRLGDVLLTEKNAVIEKVEGVISWQSNVALTLPSKVKIVSESSNSMWTTANVDSLGHYTTKLPKGTYQVFSAVKNVNVLSPKNNESFQKVRLDEYKNVIFEVSTESINKIDTLKLHDYSAPSFLIPKRGVLFDSDTFKSFELDQFVQTYKNYLNIPGLSLAIVKDGKLIYNKQFGVESTISQKPVSNSSIFEIASVSKIFFAFAVNRLVEKGLIDIDRPLFEYLPFEQIQKDERSKLITARHVLSHQSGLPNWLWGGPNGWKSNNDGELLFTPGTNYQYSGEGYEYLGRVVEKITGKRIQEVIDEEVFLPIGINNSSFSAINKLMPNIVVGHTGDYPMFWDLNREAWVAGSMYSNTMDMSKFMIGIMQGKGLAKESYKKMFAPQIENKEPFLHFFGGNRQWHSLGFELEDTPNGRIIHHGGNNGDFQARFALQLEKKVGFILLTNNDNGFLMDLALQEYLFSGRISN